jgi:hypothetical protein
VFRPAPVKAQVERFAEYQLQDEAVLIDTVDDNDSVSSTLHTLIPPRDLETTREYNAQPVQVRAFDKKKWREITAGADFRETSKPSTNFSIPWLGPVLKVLAYPVIIAVVVALLYLVIKNVTLDLKIRRDKLKGADIETQLDSIDDIDLDALLDHARKNGDFKVAVRLYYLKLLKKLDEMEKIVWKKDKTNRDYLSELFAKDFHFQQVRGLTRSYESVWYGDHEINRESLQRICLQFESAFAELNNPAAP